MVSVEPIDAFVEGRAGRLLRFVVPSGGEAQGDAEGEGEHTAGPYAWANN